MIKRVVCCLLILSIVGCSSGGVAPVKYYLVEPIAQSDITEAKLLAIEISELDIPQYLERFQIASRSADNQLIFSANHQWGENLRKNLSRTMAQNLSHYLQTPDVGTPMHRSSSTPDYRVTVFLDRFERDASGYVRLSSRWQLATGKDRTTLVTRTSHLESDSRSSANDYATSVDMMSNLFAELAQQIAEAIESEENGNQP